MTSFASRFSLLFATFLIASCAHKQGSISTNSSQNQAEKSVLVSFWTGRISLQVQSEPTQSFFAGFELKGQASAGELRLLSPLGNILAILRWSPTEAVLQQGTNTRLFSSPEDLLLQATGAAVPLSALFDWLAGKKTDSPGWVADLSQQSNGRIIAQRSTPTPTAELRILLDK